MKTLHLTNSYHPTSGGIREFYHALLRHASRANHYMRLVVPWSESAVDDLDSQARIYRVRAPNSPLFDTRYRVLLPSALLRPHGRILRILHEEQPDLIEVCDKYSLVYLAGLIRMGWMRGLRRPGTGRIELRTAGRQLCELRGARSTRPDAVLAVHEAHLPSAVRPPRGKLPLHGGRAATAGPQSSAQRSRAPDGRRCRALRPRSAIAPGASGAARSHRGRRKFARARVCRAPGAGKERWPPASCSARARHVWTPGLPPGHRRLWTARGHARRRMRGGGSWPSHFSPAPEP